MTLRQPSFLHLLIMVASLTILGVALALSAAFTTRAGAENVADRGLLAENGPGQNKVAAATRLPEGFAETEILTDLKSPTNMEFSPDGRLFVMEQSGKIHLLKNDELLLTPFLTIEVDSSAEGGLVGLTFDPDFSNNGYFYVYYTVGGDPPVNRLSRFTVSAANPDVADPSSELVILDGIPAGIQHNGGELHFASDGKLYVATGDAKTYSNAQSLETLAGKILRVNPDGSVPEDNPFVGVPDARGEIWAYGLRNPFTGDIDPVTDKIHINDVGGADWEEINLGVPGANYGWPECEGECADSDYQDPLYTYPHPTGCAITGGVFYRGDQFPEEYQGNYFFADHCKQWIKRLLPDGTATDFATGAPKRVIDLEVGPDGSLYYLLFSKSSYNPSEADGAVSKIQFGDSNRDPAAVVLATPVSGEAPLAVSFDARQSSDPDGDSLSYTWDFGDGSSPTTGATASHTYDQDGLFEAQLVVDDQKGGTSAATVTIAVGSPPEGSITSPEEGTTFDPGDTIQYAGTATDPDDGDLPPSAFTWSVLLLHHPETDPLHHVHPFLGPVDGVVSGSFQIPQEVHDDDTWFRIYLTVTDSDGLTHESTRDIFPNE
jgi:glucose/arabinose dehydrogenase